MSLTVIGVDPGPVPGIVVLTYDETIPWTHDDFPRMGVKAFQCTANAAPDLVRCLIPGPTARTLVQVEAFVSGRRAARSSTASAGKATRDLVGALEHQAAWSDVTFIQRNAGQVKPWATDARLAAVKTHGTDLLDVVSHVGRHARDAARHALFAACHDGGVPDPLSRKASS